MTKNEALEAMKQGKKLTHKNFTGDEWVTTGVIGYRFEDNCQCDKLDFWRYRHDDSWSTGWSIFNDKGE